MTFQSILFKRTEDSMKKEILEAPTFFVDLNLDQIIDAVTAGRQEYNLKPFFYISLNDIDAIKYRHEIFRDLEDKNLFANIKSFAQKMRAMREHLAQADKLYYKYQKERWFLNAVDIYCDAVNRLVHDLSFADLKSRGFLAFREYMTNYADSERFTSLQAETKKLLIDLSSVKYCLLIKGNSIKVRKYEFEIDYSANVEKTFEKFKQGAVKDYRVHTFTISERDESGARALSELKDRGINLVANALAHILSFFKMLRTELAFYIGCLNLHGELAQMGEPTSFPLPVAPYERRHSFQGLYDVCLALTMKQKIVGNDGNADKKTS